MTGKDWWSGNNVYVDVDEGGWDRKVTLAFSDSSGKDRLEKNDFVVFTAEISEVKTLFWTLGLEVVLRKIDIQSVQRPKSDM